MGANQSRRDMIVGSLNDIDDNFVINQGTSEMRQPQLMFHSIHGTNISLQRGGRLARRHESFCKGLAFSNRPIGVDENVCIKQCEVATNWSGVLRFGVTNIDPETYRNTQVPKFACPDLSSKEGYWAKALPERYSVEGNILHFYVNDQGELYYGVNGQQKGLFLMGINTSLPLWVIVDIYGNSTAVEFIDASEHRPLRRPRSSTAPTPSTASVSIAPAVPPPPRQRSPPKTVRQPELEERDNGNAPSISFHRVVGRHITLSSGRTIAARAEHEYSHGYVFTDRPVANNEKITILITNVVDLYHGGLAVGLTCCDPASLRGVELPADSSDLVNFPDMFVGIKDVANKPPVNTKLSFWVSDKAELRVQVNDREPRTLIYVDNTLQLYFYFDVYGSTQAIKLLGSSPIVRSRSPNNLPSSSSRLSETAMPTHVALPSRPSNPEREDEINQALARDFSTNIRMDSASGTTSIRSTPRPPLPARRDERRGSDRPVVDLLTGNIDPVDLPSLPAPLTPSGVAYRGSSPALPSRPAPSLPPSTTARRPPAPPPVSSIPSLTPRMSPSIPPPTEAPPARPSLPPFSTRPSSIADLTSRAFPTSSYSSSISHSSSTPSSTFDRSAATAAAAAAASAAYTPRPTVAAASSNGNGTNDTEDSEECTVCMAAPINSVIYTCGHMCMCYDCALQTKDLGRGCPICRKPMQDVIKTFKT